MRDAAIPTKDKILTATVREVYEAQRKVDAAQWRVRDIREDVYDGGRTGSWAATAANPTVVAAQAEADALEVAVTALQAEVGGKVYRVVAENIGTLQARIAKLNKRAAKLGVDPIILTVTGEQDEEKRREGGLDRVYTFQYVTLKGSAPQVPGYVLLAALDHTADQGADEAVAVRRVPLTWVSDDDTREAMEAVDLVGYRHAENRCEHCGYKRQRNTTYVVYSIEEATAKQVGSDCLADYTGSKDPHRIAQWAEWLVTLDADLTVGGDLDSLLDGGYGGGRVAIATVEYLAHVAACIREDGWAPRWSYGERNGHNTADAAHNNIRNYGKTDKRGNRLYSEVTDADRTEAETVLAWVRDDIGERDDLNDYLHNLVTYCRGDYLPEKGDGFIASAVNAYRREREKTIEREREADTATVSEWIGEPKQRLELTWTVTYTNAFEGLYGTRYLAKGITADGNRVLWWGSYSLDQGTTYSGKWTVKKHDTDSYLAGAKTTELTRPAKLVEVETEVAA